MLVTTNLYDTLTFLLPQIQHYILTITEKLLRYEKSRGNFLEMNKLFLLSKPRGLNTELSYKTFSGNLVL